MPMRRDISSPRPLPQITVEGLGHGLRDRSFILYSIPFHTYLPTKKKKKQGHMHPSTAPAPVLPCLHQNSLTKPSSCRQPPVHSAHSFSSDKSFRQTVRLLNYQPPSQQSGTNANLDVGNVLCPGDSSVDTQRNVSKTDERVDNQKDPGGEKHRRKQ
jgi:hypothetical protein